MTLSGDTVMVWAMNKPEAEYLAQVTAGPDYHVSFIKHTVNSQPEGTTCKTQDHPTRGQTRKWVTKHYIYQYDFKIPQPDGSFHYKGMKKVGEATTKTDAVGLAKEHAIKHQQRTTVRVVKVLQDGTNIEADIEPKRSLDEYIFKKILNSDAKWLPKTQQ